MGKAPYQLIEGTDGGLPKAQNTDRTREVTLPGKAIGAAKDIKEYSG